jgi:hypothetical protein
MIVYTHRSVKQLHTNVSRTLCAQVLVAEAHSIAGGAAHCWSRRGCHFDSGTALFFGLPAQQQQQQQSVATNTSSSSSSRPLCNPASVSAATECGAAVAASIAGSSSSSSSNSSSSSREARSPDNPLSAVMQILGVALDVIPYGPDRTCLVFPQGTFRAQVPGHCRPGSLWGGGVIRILLAHKESGVAYQDK